MKFFDSKKMKGFTKESGRAELCFLFKNWLGRVVYVPSERMFHNRRSPAVQTQPDHTGLTPPAQTQVNTNLSCNSAPSLFGFRHSAQCDVPFSSVILENWKRTDSRELTRAALSCSVPCVVGVLGVWDLEVPVLSFRSAAVIVVVLSILLSMVAEVIG